MSSVNLVIFCIVVFVAVCMVKGVDYKEVDGMHCVGIPIVEVVE